MSFFDDTGDLDLVKLILGFLGLLFCLFISSCIAISVVYTFLHGLKGLANLIREIKTEMTTEKQDN
jgi:hypothetical protein